jgi:hypothetical protein
VSLRRHVPGQLQGDGLFYDLSFGRAGVHDDGVAEFGVRGQGYRRSVLCPTSLPAVCRFTFVKDDRSKPLFDGNMAEIALVLRQRRRTAQVSRNARATGKNCAFVGSSPYMLLRVLTSGWRAASLDQRHAGLPTITHRRPRLNLLVTCSCLLIGVPALSAWMRAG